MHRHPNKCIRTNKIVFLSLNTVHFRGFQGEKFKTANKIEKDQKKIFSYSIKQEHQEFFSLTFKNPLHLPNLVTFVMIKNMKVINYPRSDILKMRNKDTQSTVFFLTQAIFGGLSRVYENVGWKTSARKCRLADVFVIFFKKRRFPIFQPTFSDNFLNSADVFRFFSQRFPEFST